MFKIPFRFWVAVLIFLSTFTNYAMRVNMSVSIIALSNKDKGQVKVSVCEQERSGTTTAEPTSSTEGNATTTEEPTTPKDTGLFAKQDYDQFVQSQILAGYGYGYIVLSIPGGFFAEYFGPFRTIFWANLASAILTALCVPAVWVHWALLIVLRFLIGALGGVVYPALQILISRWAPPNEKGKFLSCMLGNTIGTAVMFPLLGVISDYTNWAWGFIFVTAFTAIYLVLIFIFLSDSPQTSRFVSQEEKEFLASVMPPSKTKLVAPYLKIFGSYRFWGLCVAHLANLYGLFVLLLSVPKFFADYLGFDIKRSGGLSALPQLVRMFTGIMFGSVGDLINRKEICTKNVVRKTFILFSHLLPGLCMISMMFVGCNWEFATALLVLSQGLNGAVVVTTLQNPQDLAPNFAGTIFGIVSTIGGVTQFLVPIITGALTAKGTTMDEWQWVFTIGGAIYLIGGILFICFATATKQPWNEPKETAV